MGSRGQHARSADEHEGAREPIVIDHGPRAPKIVQSGKTGSRVIRHVVLPASLPAALIELYFTPKTVFGCLNRGYLAIGIVLLATVSALVTTAVGTRALRRGRPEALWWLVTTGLLCLPALLLFKLA